MKDIVPIETSVVILNFKERKSMVFGHLYFSILIGSVVTFLPLHGQNHAKKIYNRGVISGTLGQFESAKAEFENALEVDSLYVPAKLNLIIIDDVLNNRLEKNAATSYFQGIAFGNEDSLDRKINMLNQALEISPDFGLAYNERGIAYANKRDYHLAIQNYDAAIKIISDLPEIYFNKALSCDRLGKESHALEAYRNFLKYAPDSYFWYIFHARRRITEIENFMKDSTSVK